MKDDKSALKRVRVESKAKRVAATPSPSAALDSGGASGEEARSFTEQAQPSSGAVATAQAYRQESPAPPAESNPAPEPKRVHAEGCVEQGVEAGCLMVKDRQSGKLYRILVKGLRPKPGDGIELIGVPNDGPSFCMQGIPLNVITWAEKSSLNCSQTGAPKK
jgi:hypothetical protein